MKRTVAGIFALLIMASGPSQSSAQIAVIGKLAHDLEATPGNTYSGSVQVHNNGKTPRQAKIFQTDYSFAHDGSNEFGAPGSVNRSNAQWIEFSPSFVTVPPGESIPVSFEVTVPADSSLDLSGSYWSVIMIEDVPEDSPESTINSNREEIKVGLREVFRYAVQVATHIRNSDDYNIEFVEVDVVENPSAAKSLKVAVANSGAVFLNPKVWIEVFDADGKNLGRLESDPSRMYPDTSVSHWFDLGNFSSGDYEVLVVVDAGDENVFGAQYSVAL